MSKKDLDWSDVEADARRMEEEQEHADLVDDLEELKEMLMRVAGEVEVLINRIELLQTALDDTPDLSPDSSYGPDGAPW